MPRLNGVQRSFLKNFFHKLLFFPAIWFFIWAIYPLANHQNLTIYLMGSLFNWLLFIVSLVVAVFLELFATNPDIRAYFTRLDRTTTLEKTTEEPHEKKRKRNKEDYPKVF